MVHPNAEKTEVLTWIARYLINPTGSFQPNKTQAVRKESVYTLRKLRPKPQRACNLKLSWQKSKSKGFNNFACHLRP